MLSFIGFEKMNFKDFKIFRDEVEKIEMKYRMKRTNITIDFTNKLKVTGGTAEYKGFEKYYIKISENYYNTFGLNRVLEILKHEFAHVISHRTYYNGMEHDENFLKICKELGGTVNYQQSSDEKMISNEFLRRIKIYEYTCKCGCKLEKINHRIYRRQKIGILCSICGTSLDEWIEKKLIKYLPV